MSSLFTLSLTQPSNTFTKKIMIKIARNPNFPEWWNITLDGKLVDNARKYATALKIAEKLKGKTNKPIFK